MGAEVYQKEFEAYLENRYGQHKALLPKQKLMVLQRLRKEAQEGKFPISANQIAQVPTSDPAIQDILRGEEVAIGGETIVTKKSFADRLDTMPKKIAATAVMMIGMVLLGMLMLNSGDIIRWFRRGKNAPAAAAQQITMTATVAPTKAETVVVVITNTPAPTATVLHTPTAIAVGKAKLSVGSSGEPISIALEDIVYLLTEGEVDNNGVWNPYEAEWLIDTVLRRVVSIPWSDELNVFIENAKKSPLKTDIYIRLRGGGMVHYVVEEVINVKQHEVEYMKANYPSVLINFHGMPASDRVAIIGIAIQPTPLPSTATYTPMPTKVTPLSTQELTETSVALSQTPTPTIQGTTWWNILTPGNDRPNTPTPSATPSATPIYAVTHTATPSASATGQP